MTTITEKQFYNLLSQLAIEAVHIEPDHVIDSGRYIIKLDDFITDSNSEDDWSILHRLSIQQQCYDDCKTLHTEQPIKVLIVACTVDFLYREEVERIYSFTTDENKNITLNLDDESKTYDASMWRMGIDRFDEVPISIIPLESYLDSLNCDAIGIDNHWITAIFTDEQGNPIKVS